MNIYYPLTTAINRDSEKIIEALDRRSLELKKSIDSQSLLKKISLVALETLELAAGITAVACLPVLAISIITPLSIVIICALLVMTCEGVSRMFYIRSPEETKIREKWNALFSAIRSGQGTKITQASKDLYSQKNKQPAAYKECIGNLHPEDVDPFLYKTTLVGNLLIAIDYLKEGNIPQAQVSAQIALKESFTLSKFPEEIKVFLNSIITSPNELVHFLADTPTIVGLHALDEWIYKKSARRTI